LWKSTANFFHISWGVGEFIAFSTQSNQSPAREPSKSASLVQKSAKTTSQLLIAAALYFNRYTGCIEYCQLQARLLPGS